MEQRRRTSSRAGNRTLNRNSCRKSCLRCKFRWMMLMRRTKFWNRRNCIIIQNLWRETRPSINLHSSCLNFKRRRDNQNNRVRINSFLHIIIRKRARFLSLLILYTTSNVRFQTCKLALSRKKKKWSNFAEKWKWQRFENWKSKFKNIKNPW